MDKKNSNPTILGIIGFPLGHTLSPHLHQKLFDRYKVNSTYLVFPYNPSFSLPQFREISRWGIRGLSVTIPFKEYAFESSDIRDPLSEKMKSSNTLIFNNDKIYSYNTDGPGAIQAIKRYEPSILKEKAKIMILGSGGSARGIAFPLLESIKESGSKVFITSRNQVKGQDLMRDLLSYFPDSVEWVDWESKADLSLDMDLLIQTTPMGMKGNEQSSPIPKEKINSNSIIFDIVYNPQITPLVQNALDRKCKIIPGISMLVYQGILQFSLFHDIQIHDPKIGDEMVEYLGKFIQ
jgi:shikimate dehydrogenase